MTSHEYQRLLQRYYDGATTLDEERRLKAYWAQAKAGQQRPERAVAAYWAMTKHRAAVRSSASRQHFPAVTFMRIAASVLLCTAVGLSFLHTPLSGEQCVAYVNGEKITDSEAVMQLMHNTVNETTASLGVPTMEQQMNAMFDLPKH